MRELVGLPAQQVVTLLLAGGVTPVELVEAAVARIEATDRRINALPTRCVDRALDQARRIAAARRSGDTRFWLGGLPIAVKDVTDVAGVRTTHGSKLFADNVPTRSDILVERLEQRGAIVLAKSNTPEFAAGVTTSNEVFGSTANPWDLSKTCGGSSGGSAAALAAGQVWLATGTDLSGSVRTPASFCSVVGLRPSPGRIAHGPSPLPYNTFTVQGPLARTVGDAALMLDAMSGEHAADPLSSPVPRAPFVDAVRSRRPPRRVAFSPDLGITPVDPEVAEICARAATRFADCGAAVERAAPDFGGAVEAYHVLRAANFLAACQPLVERHRGEVRPEIAAAVDRARTLSPDEVARAERTRGALFHRVVAFFGVYDVLLCPAAIVPPFDLGVARIESVAGHAFAHWLDWLSITYVVTFVSCPAIVVPCGFTRHGLPVGMQIVGPPKGEAAILAAGAVFEEAMGIADRTPVAGL